MDWIRVTPARLFQNFTTNVGDVIHCGNVNDLSNDFDLNNLVNVLSWVITPPAQIIKGGAPNWDMLMLLQYLVIQGYINSTVIAPAPTTYYRIMPSNNIVSHTGFPPMTMNMRIWSPDFWTVTLQTMDYAEANPQPIWTLDDLCQLWVDLGGWTDGRSEY